MIRRGEIWWAELGDPRGSEPGFRRRVLVVQGDAFDRSHIATVIVVAITSDLRLAEAPGNVRLQCRDRRLPRDSVANVSQVLTLDRRHLSTRVARLPKRIVRSVDEGLRLVLELRIRRRRRRRGWLARGPARRESGSASGVELPQLSPDRPLPVRKCGWKTSGISTSTAEARLASSAELRQVSPYRSLPVRKCGRKISRIPTSTAEARVHTHFHLRHRRHLSPSRAGPSTSTRCRRSRRARRGPDSPSTA